MPKNALAVASISSKALQKSKPRYTDVENEMLFESWWNPQKRRELVNRLGRKMSALRSQFCRLLKEKGLSNQEYYNLMQARYTQETGVAPRRRSREVKDIDRIILEDFCKHQALGHSRADACEDLQQKLGDTFTAAALKLRFYRLIKRFQYSEVDLEKIGKELLNKEQNDFVIQESKSQIESTKLLFDQPLSPDLKIQADSYSNQAANSFFYQISSLPTTVLKLEERVGKLENAQLRQLDLRGFIEHLLAVERDLKREDKLMEEIQHLMDENENLQHAYEKERFRIKKREEELSDVYQILNSMLSDFMNLESVSKLASLGDFMHRLEITVDQFGNVLKSKRFSHAE